MMLKLLALTSVLTSAVLAQTPSTSANPLIPDGITQPCSTFLNTLNSDPTLASCLSALTTITSKFAPGAPTPSSADVSSSLTNLCTNSVTTACPESLIRSQIMSFYGACPNELKDNPIQAVRNMYDVLYTILPLQESICSKDDSGNDCVNGPSTTARDFDENDTFSIAKLLALLYIKTDNGALTRRDEAVVPNMDAISQNNSIFLFFKPDFSEPQLCVTCLRKVLTAYIKFEEDIPFAYGIDNSVLLSPQLPLYNAVQSKCPANFLSGAVIAAGGLAGSSAIPAYSAEYQRIIALVMGAVTLVISFAL